MPRFSDCHPDRLHYGKGQCKLCYIRDYRKKRYEKDPEFKQRLLQKNRESDNRNKKARQAYRNNWKKENPDRVKASCYGFSIEKWTSIQTENCSICKNKFKSSKDKHFDHDHACCPSGKGCPRCFRGFICHSCNMMLGGARDNITTLLSGVEYLAQWKRRKIA